MACGAPTSVHTRCGARRLREARTEIVSALMKDSSKVLDLFRSWDEDGDGEISHTEFQKAIPRLGIKAKYAEVKALFRSWNTDGSGQVRTSPPAE